MSHIPCIKRRHHMHVFYHELRSFRGKERDHLEDLSSPTPEKIYESVEEHVKTAGTIISYVSREEILPH